MTCSVCGKPIIPGKQKYYRQPSGKRKHASCTALARPPGSAADLVHRLYMLVIEHHEYGVMREEHWCCPVCTKPENDKLLSEAVAYYKQQNGESSDGATHQKGTNAN